MQEVWKNFSEKSLGNGINLLDKLQSLWYPYRIMTPNGGRYDPDYRPGADDCTSGCGR